MDLVGVENAIANEQIVLQQSITQPTSLNDLIEDCKEMVFEHLGLADMLNIADTNTQLQPTVRQVFERNHSTRRIVIDIENNNKYVHCYSNIIKINKCHVSNDIN